METCFEECKAKKITTLNRNLLLQLKMPYTPILVRAENKGETYESLMLGPISRCHCFHLLSVHFRSRGTILLLSSLCPLTVCLQLVCFSASYLITSDSIVQSCLSNVSSFCESGSKGLNARLIPKPRLQSQSLAACVLLSCLDHVNYIEKHYNVI